MTCLRTLWIFYLKKKEVRNRKEIFNEKINYYAMTEYIDQNRSESVRLKLRLKIQSVFIVDI